MQPETLANQTFGGLVTTPLTVAAPEFTLTEEQMAQLPKTWLDHPIKPQSENETGGVPFSALND